MCSRPEAQPVSRPIGTRGTYLAQVLHTQDRGYRGSNGIESDAALTRPEMSEGAASVSIPNPKRADAR